MSKYIDGFVLVVPRGKEAEYQKMAEEGRDSWMKHGALHYFECRGDDLKPQEAGDENHEPFPKWREQAMTRMSGFHSLFSNQKSTAMR